MNKSLITILSLLSSPVAVQAVEPAIAAGLLHSLFLKSDGTVWSCGANWSGQLGNGTYADQNHPSPVITGVKAISAGEMHSIFLKQDGTVWAAGAGNDGRLGDGTTIDRNLPVAVQISGVAAISAGKDFSLFLKTDGTVWACGNNGSGRLGVGEATGSCAIPVQVQISEVKAIDAGDCHSLFLRTDGSAWACGNNYSSQLGDGTNITRYTPVQVMTEVMAIAAAGYGTLSHSLFLKTDGSVWACGSNGWGQLGLGTEVGSATLTQALISDVTSITAGQYRSFFLKSDNTVWACGYNERGVFGNSSAQGSYLTPVHVQDEVIGVAAGGTHTQFLKIDGSAWAAGMNANGPLGDGTWTDRPTAVKIMDLEIKLNAASSLGGTVSGSGSYIQNEVASLTATPAPGYLFASWAGDATGTDNPLSVLMDADKTITANFTPDTNDEDNDGLTNYQEIVEYGTDPTKQDTDNDGVKDAVDDLPLDPAETLDTDHDGIGDNADPDDDNDGLSDVDEINTHHTNPKLADSDGDGLSDPDELQVHTTNPNIADTDNDGLNDGEELLTHHTNPKVNDTDADGFLDGYEVLTGKSPLDIADHPALVAEARTAIEFTFPAALGKTYRIEDSPDLATWTTVESGIAGNGQVVQRFYTTRGMPMRYFRVEEDGL